MSQRVFGFPTGSKASSYTQLYLAFFLSGLVHVEAFDPGAIRFFMSQAVVITFEDIIIAVAKMNGFNNSKGVRFLGYIWVCCSLTLTFGPWLDSIYSVGCAWIFRDMGVRSLS